MYIYIYNILIYTFILCLWADKPEPALLAGIYSKSVCDSKVDCSDRH